LINIVLDIINYILVAILIGVSAMWIVLIKSMLKTFHESPFLDKFEKKEHEKPKVSIILPARNEEKFIEKCLDSLIKQDYDNYEIVTINDSSKDSTGDIIKKYSEKFPKVVFVDARPKPDGWMGKNWACIEGYKKASGDLLLFTDADTIHTSSVISLAVSHLLSLELDVLTVIPRMLCLDKITKITLPMISTFLHTRFSALRVNDTSKNTGYFFGSFFIIKKSTYDSVGTHEGVKGELVEDGALGKKVKESGFKMRMVRGEHLVDAVWARDMHTLWNALKRLMISFYLQNAKMAVASFFGVLFLLFMAFPILGYSIIFFNSTDSFLMLFAISCTASILVYIGGVLDATKGLDLKIKYSLFAPVGSFIVVCGFLAGLTQAESKTALSWRGRTYNMKGQSQKSINV
jgi:glycosyltransferase involved in cell wall biosynthesis